VNFANAKNGSIARDLARACLVVVSLLPFLFLTGANTIIGPAISAAAGLPQPSQSSPIALDNRGNLLVTVNPDANSITVFKRVSNLQRSYEIPVGRDPVSVAVGPRKKFAYVANAADGTVSIVDLPKGSSVDTLSVGVEPRAVALSPNDDYLYVANSASNSLTVINTSTQAVVATVDLSPFGKQPRAISVTNDGDRNDADETIFVAMFFADLRPGKTATDEGLDDERQGRVVAISAATYAPLASPNPIALEPMAVTGFRSNGRLAPGPAQVPNVASTNPQTFNTDTGAFPNQLASIAIHPYSNRAYVVSTGASPNGPLRFNVMNQGLVSVFDTLTRTEVTAAQTDATVRRTAPLNLNQGINLATTPAPRLFHTNPVAMSWRPDGTDAWAVIQNSDVVVRLTADAAGIPTIGAPLAAGPSSIVRVDLQAVSGDQIPGKAPRGIVIDPDGSRAYVNNFVSRSVTVLDISNPTAPTIVDTVQTTALPAAGSVEATALLGAELFYTGRGPDTRMSSESWGGCITCHPDGRADGVTWMFDAGPRQTVPLDGMFNKSDIHDQRILNWSAVRDENQDFELNTRGVFGGRGLIDDDRLFLAVGGASGATPTDSGIIEQFQNFTGAVTTTNDLAGGAALPGWLPARRDFAMATLLDGRIYIIGGRSGAGEGSLLTGSDAVLEFNPHTNTLTPKSSTGFTPRHSLGAAAVQTALGPRIYAIGGYSSTSGSAAPSSTVEEYNPSTNTWRTVASLPSAVAQFGITVAGGVNLAEPLQLIHVVAGNAASAATPSNVASVQRFQADASGPGTWATFSPGLTARRNLGAATVFRGVQSRVFVIGGEDAGGVSATVEEYQAQAVTLVPSTHTPLPVQRARFGIGSTTTTNQIYVIGGVDGGGADQTSILELTVANNGPVAGPAGTPSGSWTTRGNLSSARRDLKLSSPPGVTNFLPAASGGRDPRQDAIATWIATKVRSGRAPVSASDPAATTGRTLFGTAGLVIPGFSCATCHGGAKWTRSKVDYIPPPAPTAVIGAELRQTATQGSNVLINVGTFALAGGRVNEIRSNPADVSQAVNPLGANGFNIPSLLSVHETTPYFYSGLAQSLEEVLNGSQDANGGVRHHFVTNVSDRAALIAFLRSIDQTTPVFP